MTLPEAWSMCSVSLLYTFTHFMSESKSVSCSDRNIMSTVGSYKYEELDVGEADCPLVLSLVLIAWHFFLFVSLWPTIAVTFRRILHCREEGDTTAMTECIFDWRRGTRWRRCRARKTRTGGWWDRGRTTLCLSHPITSKARHFVCDILVSDISSIFWVRVICREQQLVLEDSRQMRGKIDWKDLINVCIDTQKHM